MKRRCVLIAACTAPLTPLLGARSAHSDAFNPQVIARFEHKDCSLWFQHWQCSLKYLQDRDPRRHDDGWLLVSLRVAP